MRAVLATLFALAVALVVPASAQQPEKFQEGRHYMAIDPVQPTSSGNKIEVLAVFMYTCPHCYDLEPFLAKWQATKAADVAYSHFPAAWDPVSEAYARAFYAAETLGILEKSHDKLFDLLHREHKRLASMDEIAQWYTQFGVTQEAFLGAAQSFAVNSKVNRSKAMVPRWGVAGTPTVVINGKWRIDVASAGGQQNLIELMDVLIAKERAAAKPGT